MVGARVFASLRERDVFSTLVAHLARNHALLSRADLAAAADALAALADAEEFQVRCAGGGERSEEHTSELQSRI